MKVRIKRIDTSLPLPEYQTEGAVAFDLIIREDRVVDPFGIELLPTNIIVEIPAGYILAVLPRSSMVKKKKGLIIPHSFGLIDQDYHGPDDEVCLLVQNITDKPIEIKRGERLGQAAFMRVDKAVWQEVKEHFKHESRGGYGSTG